MALKYNNTKILSFEIHFVRFFGLETVCIELSDPFGDDANDFDQIKIARVSKQVCSCILCISF